MERIKVVCVGVSPILINHMPQAVLGSLGGRGQKKKYVAPEEPRDEAASKLYLTNDTKEPYIPSTMLMSCLIVAGKFIKLNGKTQMSTATSTLLPAFLTLEDVYCLIKDKDGNKPTWEVDMQQGRNPNGGEAVCIIRPRFDSWSFKFSILADTKALPEQTFRDLIDIAGRQCGLGDFRPQRKGTYGRFQVNSWMK